MQRMRAPCPKPPSERPEHHHPYHVSQPPLQPDAARSRRTGGGRRQDRDPQRCTDQRRSQRREDGPQQDAAEARKRHFGAEPHLHQRGTEQRFRRGGERQAQCHGEHLVPHQHLEGHVRCGRREHEQGPAPWRGEYERGEIHTARRPDGDEVRQAERQPLADQGGGQIAHSENQCVSECIAHRRGSIRGFLRRPQWLGWEIPGF